MKSGSLLNLDKSCSPLSVFEAIFDAATFRSNKPLQPTELLGPTWENVTVPEMKSFIGILIAMEIHRLPAVNDYWSMDPLLGDPGIFQYYKCYCVYKNVVFNLHSKIGGENMGNLKDLV